MSLAPIVLFVYNRLDHTKKTVEALQKNFLAKKSRLFIYSDAAKNQKTINDVEKVRKFINTIDGFKKVTIVYREKNWGLANSIIDGVSTIISEYGKIIVLEDDLVTSVYFLKFMNEALEFYKEKSSILSVTGYSFPKNTMPSINTLKDDIYIHIRPMSWSWATWVDRWEKVTWDMAYFDKFISNFKNIDSFNKGGKDLTLMLLDQYAGRVDSWYIRWAYHAYILEKYTIYPKFSLIQNLGFDDSGVHGKSIRHKKFFHKVLEDISCWKFKEDIKMNKILIKNFNKIFLPELKTRISLRLRLLTKLDNRLKIKRM